MAALPEPISEHQSSGPVMTTPVAERWTTPHHTGQGHFVVHRSWKTARGLPKSC